MKDDMSPLADELRSRLRGGPLVLDGAMGTELERRGVGSPAPLWSAAALLEAPEVVAAIHRDFVTAGADVIVANTFRTNPRALRAAGLEARGEELNHLAVTLARQAASESDRDVLVAASVAPLEDCYRPELAPEEDVLFAERGLPFVASLVVRESGDLLGGEALEDAVAAVEPLGPLALGLNCIPPRGLSAILPRLRRATKRPLAAYAHINNPAPIRGWSYAQSVGPDAYADYAAGWFDIGASIVGGCCGTTPAHVQAIRQALSGR